MDHGVVPSQFCGKRGMDGFEVVIGTGPICGAVYRPAIAQDNGGIVAGGARFELPLNVEDGALGGLERAPMSRRRGNPPPNTMLAASGSIST